MVIYVTGLIVLWLAGGSLLVDSAIRAAVSRGDAPEFLLTGLRRFEPAALVALAALILVWPFVFVGLKISRLWEGGR